MASGFDIAEAAACGLLDVGEYQENSYFRYKHEAWIRNLVGIVAVGLGVPLGRPEGRAICMSWIRQLADNRNVPGCDIGRLFRSPADKRVARRAWRTFEKDILDPLECACRLLALSEGRAVCIGGLR